MNRHPARLQDKAATHKIRQVKDTPAGAPRYTITSGASGDLYTVTILPERAATCTCQHAYWEYRKANPQSEIEYSAWKQYTTDHPDHAQISACSHTVKVLTHAAHRAGRTVKLYTSEHAARRRRQKIGYNGDGITIITPKKQTRNP